MTQNWFVIRLAEHVEAHIFIGLGGRLWLLLFFLGFLSGTTGGSSTSGGGSGTNSGADVGDQLGNVAVLESAGEKAGPEGLNIDAGSLDTVLLVVLEEQMTHLEERSDLVTGNIDPVVAEDKSSISARQFSRHF